MTTLNARDFGTTGKPALVLLHGLLGSSRNWQTVGRDLADTYHVRALDLRNHGASPHTATISYEAMVDDVLFWMDREGIQAAALLGHSMGGKVAMQLACRNPQRVSRLIVVDIAPTAYLSQAHRAEFAAMNELDLTSLQSRAEAELRFESRVPDWSMRKFLTTNLERTDAGAWRWSVNLPLLTEALPLLEGNSLRADDRYEGPVHVILGGKSRYVNEADRAKLSEHFPKVRVTVIPEAGHNPHMEARADFVQAVRSSD